MQALTAPELTSIMIAETQRGLRYQRSSVSWTGLTIVFSASIARSTPLAAVLVAICGVGLVFAARSMRASAALLRIAGASAPEWVTWLAPALFLVGPLIAAFGAWLLVTGLFSR